jgi:hypothetical protein
MSMQPGQREAQLQPSVLMPLTNRSLSPAQYQQLQSQQQPNTFATLQASGGSRKQTNTLSMTRKLQTGNEQYHNSRVDNTDATLGAQRTQSHNKSVNQPGSGEKLGPQGGYQYPDRSQGGSFIG